MSYHSDRYDDNYRYFNDEDNYPVVRCCGCGRMVSKMNYSKGKCTDCLGDLHKTIEHPKQVEEYTYTDNYGICKKCGEWAELELGHCEGCGYWR